MQLGSSPTRGMPRSTSGIKRSRLRRAFSRAASTSPAESIGLPQQTTSGRWTRVPAAAKSRTAPTPISGHWYSVQVSLKSATSAGPSPLGIPGKRFEKGLAVTFGRLRLGSIPTRAAARLARRVLARALTRDGVREARASPRRTWPVAFASKLKPCSWPIRLRTSVFMLATSTCEGHSLLHALHPTQRFMTSFIFSPVNSSGGSVPSRTERSMFARARVESCSSSVTMNEGHIVPVFFLRQKPDPLHSSTAAANPPWSVKSRLVPSGSRSRPGPMRSCSSIRGGAPQTPELVDKLRHFLADPAHPGDPLGIARVQGGADVQSPDRRVAIETRPGVVVLHYLLEARDELLQPLGRHRCILDEGDGLVLLRGAQEERQNGLAELDCLCHLLLRAQRLHLLRPDLLCQIVQFGEALV